MLFPQVRLSDEESPSPRPGCSYTSASTPRKAILKRKGSKDSKDSNQDSSMSSAVLQMLQIEKEMMEERRVCEFYFQCR